MNDLRLSYWTDRWKANTQIRLEFTESGWIFHAMAHSGPTDRLGAPHLLGNFDQDYVSYPARIDGFLGFVWDQIRVNEIDQARAQEMLDEFGAWVSACEQSQPKWHGWNRTLSDG